MIQPTGQSMAQHEHGLRFVDDEGRCLFCAVSVLTDQRDAERERATRLEECDCVPCIVSSATCGKCGRRAVISQERFMEMAARSERATRLADLLRCDLQHCSSPG